jgi:hypothetical protein
MQCWNYIMLFEGIPFDWPLSGERDHGAVYLLDEGILRSICSFIAADFERM